MSKINSIILKGVYNENFEEIFYNKNEDINKYKKLSHQHKKPEGEGMVNYSNKVYYYKTFIPEQKNQSIFYIIVCSKSLSKEKIDECFEEIYEILEQNNKFTLKNFPKIIIEEINEVFLRYSYNEKQIDSNLNITQLTSDLKTNNQEISTLQFNLDLDNNLPLIVLGDKKRILQIINEVVSNSIKYTDEGKITITVRGEKVNSDVNLKISVTDSGCGIDENKLNTIFKNDSNEGLSSVKKLIDLLGGKIEIESKVDEYTEVTILLNQKIVEDNKIREMIQHKQEAKTFDLAGKKVLIVDDNRLNIKVASRMLETYNLTITSVESGMECIDLVKENNYDLILLDQMMPGMDGITTLNKLKEINGFNTPVIALTADVIEGQKEKYLSAGFNDYLSKPIDKVELSRILDKYLNK